MSQLDVCFSGSIQLGWLLVASQFVMSPCEPHKLLHLAIVCLSILPSVCSASSSSLSTEKALSKANSRGAIERHLSQLTQQRPDGEQSLTFSFYRRIRLART